jgi:hypothetical protein
MKSKKQAKIMGRKALSTEDILKEVIIILLIVVILIFILSNVYKQYYKYIDIESCKDSIKANAYARIVIKGTDMTTKWGQVTQLKCSTEYEKISAKNEEQKKRALAESIDKCWDLYGKDGYELFDTADNTYCVVCSRLEFDDKKPITNFTQFLMTEKKGNMTYFERLYQINPHPELAGAQTKVSEQYKTDVPLGVVFVMAKEGYFGQAESTTWWVMGGAVAGAVVGGVLLYTGVLAPVAVPLITGSLATLYGIAGTVTITGGVGIVSGALIGYNVASDHSSDFDSMIMVTPYDNIKLLNCTYLEGKSTGLEVIDKEAAVK